MEKVYLNGEIVDRDQALVSVFDRGFMYGDGAFETLRSYGGVPFRAAQHWRRLERGLNRLSIPPPLTAAELDGAVAALLEANGLSDAVVRVEVTRGVGPRGPGTSFDARPTVVITCGGYVPPDESVYERGVGVAVSRVRRVPDVCIPSDVKSANYINHILARRDADAAGDYESVMLNLHGNLAEGSASNVFLVSRGVAYTPDLAGDVLPGLTRELVVELAGAEDVDVKETACTTSDLKTADEVFLTNSVIEVMPVRTVDGVAMGDECPGPVTIKLMSAYKKRVAEECGL
jgi:branched-chain amino acid aminotransferase